MRISIVPAQITTVEDKIAGNVSVQQAMLLGIPILIGFIIALVFPPSGQFVTYKIVIVISLFIICGSLAIRIKDRIVAQWLKLFVIYSARPLYYVYDKNSTYLRDTDTTEVISETVVEVQSTKKQIITTSNISPKEFVRLEQFATDTRAGMKFEIGKKGELNVHITEVK
ncbi:MAG TPA: hypothetical protein VK497_01050 [Candidatus Saccharimonadales bacterium]|nr:hypothetical protein [Candidatus Saccharimonadales bacterium]